MTEAERQRQARLARRGRAIAVTAAVLMLFASPAEAQDAAAATPNATQTANINTALAQLRADIAAATRINAGVRSRRKREENAREIGVYQRVLDNLAGKLDRGELHPVSDLADGTDDAAGTIVRFVYEDDRAAVQGSTPTAAYCPDRAYILVGTAANVAAYINITGKDATEARTRRDQFVTAGRVRRLACPRGHMIFDSGLLDPGGGVRLDATTTDGWCRTRELLDVLAHEKFHEIVIEDAVTQLRLRRDFINSNPADQARREGAVFREGASHGNHRIVYNWQIKVNQLALALIRARQDEIKKGQGAAAAAGEEDALKAKKECIERRISDLRGYARRATGGSHFHSAVIREHQECVGTTYHVSETVVEEGGTVVRLEEQTVTEDVTRIETGEGILECHEEEGSSTTYISVPPEDIPTSPDETPKNGDQPPGTTVVEEEPEPRDEPEEEIDLGLVKAVTSVVTVALTRTGSGTPIEGATVKLVDEAPELPGTALRDDGLSDITEYLKDQVAAVTGADGVLRVEEEPGIEVALVDDDIYQGTTVLDVGDPDADEDGAIRVHHKINAAEPMAQAVTAVRGAQGTAAVALAYPVALGSQWREKVCIRRSFVIGDTSFHVIRMPEEVVERFKDLVTRTESVLFVEDDPCREKEDILNSREFLRLTFAPGWSVGPADER